MTRGARGCLLAAAAMLVVLVAVAAAVMLAGGVQKGTVLQVTISGEVVEDPGITLQDQFLLGDAMVLRDIVLAIRRARDDDRISGLVAVIKPFSMGVAKVQEIRDAVLGFREAGKWTHVYLDTAGEFSGGNFQYYLATAFEEISLSPAGDVNLHGLLGVTTFLRGTFDKIGVYPDFDSIGKYKNAKDVYTEKTMTPAHREATTAFLQEWFDQMVDGIAEGRRMQRDQVVALVDEGPFTGDEALRRGMVDRLSYYDEVEDLIEEKSGGTLALLRHKQYLGRGGGSFGGPRIAVVTGWGLILTGKSKQDVFAGPIMGSETIVEALREAREDSGVKAIVLRVDSPGGSAVASDLIWRETQLARQSKPVVISQSDLAASGGYWVSMGGAKIVAQPGTLTGSIGVVAGKLVTQGLYDWAGLNREVLSLGDHASFYYDGARYSESEKAVYWRFLRKTYDQFTSKVAQGRGMTQEDVDRIGQGRVWTGRRAKELGLVDELGGLPRAIEVAKREAGIPEDKKVRLVFLPEKETSFLQSLVMRDEASSYAPASLPRGLLLPLRDVLRLGLLSGEAALALAEVPYTAP